MFSRSCLTIRTINILRHIYFCKLRSFGWRRFQRWFFSFIFSHLISHLYIFFNLFNWTTVFLELLMMFLCAIFIMGCILVIGSVWFLFSWICGFIRVIDNISCFIWHRLGGLVINWCKISISVVPDPTWIWYVYHRII